MSSRYRVEYALKTHRRDELIEWIKGLLAVPFVLHSQPTARLEESQDAVSYMSNNTHRRYAEIMRDVEDLITNHIMHQKAGTLNQSKLKLLVPSVATFFTPLMLQDAFVYQDRKRLISRRRFVPPSFNDVRLILNTAQVMSLVQAGQVELMTFDGDVTLYDDGASMVDQNPIVSRLLDLMRRGIRIGIVTAAGYVEEIKYYERLHGILDAIRASDLPERHRNNLVVMGGEANFLFKYVDGAAPNLVKVPKDEWVLDEMRLWKEDDIQALLDLAEQGFKECVAAMELPAQLLRKERAVGIIPVAGHKFSREQLEETVMFVQRVLESSPIGQRVPFCAFNGGNDVFVDIGDKSWGVQVCQKFFGGIEGSKTLHVGDQFLSAGANDFKARLACTTAWIASPAETVALLDEIRDMDSFIEFKRK